MTRSRGGRLARSVPPAPTALASADFTLLVDHGTAWTKAAVVGRAAGAWRILARAAQPAGWGADPLMDALARTLTPHVDQRLVASLPGLLASAPRISCRSARRGPRLVVVSAEPASTAIRHAVERSGWRIVAEVTARDGSAFGDRLAMAQEVDTDAWLVVGAAAGLRQPSFWELMSLVAVARGGQGAPVIPSGGPLPGPFERLFEAGAVVNPPPGASDGMAALDQIFGAVAGLPEPRHLSSTAFSSAIQAVARVSGLQVMGVDVGSAWTSWALADRSGLLASSRLAADVPVLGSLPGVDDEIGAGDQLWNQASRPWTIAATAEEHELFQDIAGRRVSAVRSQLADGPQVDLLIGSGGGLLGMSSRADAMLALLDGLRPGGVCQVALDEASVLAPLGALPDTDVEEGVETLRDDLLVPLGSVVVSRGGRGGHLAFRARVRRAGWADIGPVEVRVGALTVVPFESGAVGDIELDLAPDVRVGPSPAGRRVRATVTGGAVGIVLDARDDPIQLPARAADQRLMLNSWRSAIRREAPRAGVPR